MNNMGKTKIQIGMARIPGEGFANQTPETKTIGQGAFSKIQRELKDEDLKNPAVGRLLLDERDRLLTEKASLESFRENYYTASQKAAVFEERSKAEGKVKLLYALTLTVGGILIGAVLSTNEFKLQIVLIITGLILLIISSLLVLLIGNKPQ